MNIEHQHSLGRHSIWMTSLLLAFSLGAASCGESDGGGGGGGTDPDEPSVDAPESYGDTCIDDDDLCIDGTECRAYGAESEDRFCTVQCGDSDDCPDDSACLSLSSDDGLIKLCVPNDLCIDPDEDEYGSGPGCKGPDCDQTNPNINPGAPEICDGLDNNCSGTIDDNAVDVNYPCDTSQTGICAEGWTVCKQGGFIECEPNVTPGERQEICDGLDNDCNRLVDEGPDEDENYNFVIGIGRPCGNPDGQCFGGYQVCNSEAKAMECDGDDPFLEGVLDLCDGIDNNCNGEIDEDANDPDNLLGTPCYAGVGTCRSAATYSCDPDDPAAEPVCPAEPRDDNALPEVCDYTDNDCDGQIDNGFVNIHDDYGGERVYDGIENCGQCGNNCVERLGGDPAALGLSVRCEVSGTSATCSSECLPGRYDLDKVPANGCEFEPDLDAVYVATEVRDGTQGEDTSSCGDFDAPCRTINHAIGRADSAGKARVRVAEGIFNEPVELQNGISVMGGHSSRNWILDPAANTTTLQGSIRMDNHVTTVRAESITSTTEFSGFTIDASDAQPEGNSYGIYIKESNNNLTVKDNIVIAGRGGVGSGAGNGESGHQGIDGDNGLDRKNYDDNCSNSTNPPLLKGGAGGENSCGNTNVSGGSAVSITVCPNNSVQSINSNNATGETGKGANGGGGGVSSNHTSRGDQNGGNYLCSSGSNVSSPGLDGAAGSNGSGGSGASGANGMIGNGHWQGASGDDGGSATHGSGGGGAGSSGGIQDDQENYSVHYGPTGGGGGAGGCGGNGGEGGHAGGASIGIFVVFSSNTASIPSIEDNEITRGNGGRGGTGGAGGAGGNGGSGGEGGAMFADPGNYTRCGQNGQRGGSGGGGGHGGGGGGGAGGASFAIATAGNSNNAVNVYQNANTYTQDDNEATGGQGGAGGESIANEGAQGTQGASGRFRRF